MIDMAKEQTTAQKSATVQNKDRHLRKTKLCIFFQQGVCFHQSKCVFAHGEAELQKAPVLYKTRMCPNLDACFNPNCTFAHSQEELQVTDVSFKTAMCHWHFQGRCRNGKTCRFAHCAKELRGNHGDEEDKASQVASQADKAKQKVDDNLLQDSSNVGESAPRGARSKRHATRYAAENKVMEAHKVDENLLPMADKTNCFFNIDQPMFIQLPANKDDTKDSGAPTKARSKLSKESGILDSFRYPLGLQLSTDSMDFNIIPETQSMERDDELQKRNPTSWTTDQDTICDILSKKLGNEVQDGDPANPDLSSLVQSLQHLSREVDTLQQFIKRNQLTPCYHNAVQSSQDNSDSTNSGSVFFNSTENCSQSSSSCTPRAYQENLSEVSHFGSEYVQYLSASCMGEVSAGGFMAWQ